MYKHAIVTYISWKLYKDYLGLLHLWSMCAQIRLSTILLIHLLANNKDSADIYGKFASFVAQSY
jgi:hypothetical protein